MTDDDYRLLAKKRTQALLASAKPTPDEKTRREKLVANIFNDAFNAPAPAEAKADITISFAEGYFHVYANTRGTDQDRAKWMAERVLWFLAENRQAFIRVEPEGAVHLGVPAGFVRFSFRDEPGKWEKAEQDDAPVMHVGFGPRDERP